MTQNLQEVVDQLQLDTARARAEAKAVQMFAILTATYFFQTLEDKEAVFEDLKRVMKSSKLAGVELNPASNPVDAADLAYIDSMQNMLQLLRQQVFQS